MQASIKKPYSLKELVLYFLKLGSIGFGGPAALVGYMNRDLVEEKQWISEEDYREGLALAQLAPGPLAAQLSIYIGYIDFKIIGATLAGIAFILPSFIIVVLLGVFYVQYQGLPWMQAVFYGVGAAVIGIVTVSSFKLTKKTLGKNKLLWLILIIVTIVTFITKGENLWLILAAGFLNWMVRRPLKTTPAFSFYLLPFMLGISPSIHNNEKLMKIALFFLKAGAFVFGSGLAIVPFLYGGVVKEEHWLNEQQFLDAVAVAMITPGPVVITVGFVGFLIAGFPGAAVAATATFLPCYLFTILPAPYFKKYGRNRQLKSFIEGITAATVGAIVGAVMVLAQRQLTDIPSFFIAITVIFLLFTYKKIQEPLIVAAAAMLGLTIKYWVH